MNTIITLLLYGKRILAIPLQLSIFKKSSNENKGRNEYHRLVRFTREFPVWCKSVVIAYCNANKILLDIVTDTDIEFSKRHIENILRINGFDNVRVKVYSKNDPNRPIFKRT